MQKIFETSDKSFTCLLNLKQKIRKSFEEYLFQI